METSQPDEPISTSDALLEETPKAAPQRAKKPVEQESVKAPWVPLAMATKTISLLTLSAICLTLVTITLGVVVVTQLNKKPWIVGYNQGKYTELDPQKFVVSRDDVETFLGDIIPRIYGTVQGEAPGLDMLRGTVNPNIISTQRNNVEGQRKMLKEEGISQFAIVTGIVPNTLVINRKERFVYAEVTGVVMLARQNKSTPSEVQWRCLLYIVEPLSSLESKTPGGRVAGNQFGLYLQQIVEQTPGTVNSDSPRPTTEDEQERKEQEIRKQQNSLPTLKLE